MSVPFAVASPRRFAVRVERVPHQTRRSSLLRGWRLSLRSPRPTSLHPEYAEPRLLDRRVERGGEREREHAPRLLRGDDAVVPQPGGREIRIAFALVIVADRLLEFLLLLGAPAIAARLDVVAPHRGEHGSGLLAAHHGNSRVGADEQETRRT